MERTQNQLQGLSRAIYESLVHMTPMLLSEGEPWNDALLDRVEEDLRRQLAPRDDTVARDVFDMVFRRSFAEARSCLVGVRPLPGEDLPGLHSATA
jgi:hypothetical protein